jgi:HK97 family phage major capsid protein
MSLYLDRLFDEYRRAAKIGVDLMDLASSENRELGAEEKERRDRAHADVARLKAEIATVRTFEDLRDAGDAFRATAAPLIEGPSGTDPRRDPTLRELFARAMDNKGAGVDLMPNFAAVTAYATRALQSEGGSAVETSFADFVTVYQRTTTPMLNPDAVTILNRSDGSPLILPRLTADPNHGGTVTAEAAGINELDATFSQITLNPYKYAITNLWSAELGQDSAIALEQIIGSSTGRELGLDIGAHLTTGDGSAKPNGFITAATNGGTATGTGATYGTYFGSTDLVSLFYGRAAPYRERGSWQMNGTSLAQTRNMRDTTGQPIWQPSTQVGQPETLLGRPVYENPAMANGSAAKAVAFGDFHAYHVARVVPIRVDLSIHYKYNTDQIALRTVERVDGDLTDAIAVAYLVNAAV